MKIDKLKWGWEVLTGINSPMGTGMGKKLSPMTFAGMGTGTGKFLPYGDRDGDLTLKEKFSVDISSWEASIDYLFVSTIVEAALVFSRLYRSIFWRCLKKRAASTNRFSEIITQKQKKNLGKPPQVMRFFTRSTRASRCGRPQASLVAALTTPPPKSLVTKG